MLSVAFELAKVSGALLNWHTPFLLLSAAYFLSPIAADAIGHF